MIQASTEKVLESFKYVIETSKIADNDRREELLSELDIRLKSLAPRKGKIEVEDYDKRILEIEKHNHKYIQHTKDILERNGKDHSESQLLLKEMEDEYILLTNLFEKLTKGMGKSHIYTN